VQRDLRIEGRQQRVVALDELRVFVDRHVVVGYRVGIGVVERLLPLVPTATPTTPRIVATER